MPSTKKEVVSWKDKMAAEAKDVASIERPVTSNISLRGGVMSYMDTPVPDNRLPCVVVASVFENSWYDRPFDPDNIRAPSCFAFSADGESMAPHESSESPQSETCAACDHNKWGSAPGNSRGKACKNVRRLAVLPVTALDDADKVAEAEMAMMKLPVTSVSNWRVYVNKVAASYQRPAWGVITEISVERDPKTQFKVHFDCIGVIEQDDLLASLNGKVSAANEMLNTPYEPNQQEEETISDPSKF